MEQKIEYSNVDLLRGIKNVFFRHIDYLLLSENFCKNNKDEILAASFNPNSFVKAMKIQNINPKKLGAIENKSSSCKYKWLLDSKESFCFDSEESYNTYQAFIDDIEKDLTSFASDQFKLLVDKCDDSHIG